MNGWYRKPQQVAPTSQNTSIMYMIADTPSYVDHKHLII